MIFVAHRLLSVVMLSTFLTSIVVVEPCGDGLLPSEVRKLFNERFPAWHIVMLADLGADDRKTWESLGGERCPGIAIGHFRDWKNLSYAVLLNWRNGGVLYERLAVADELSPGRYRVRELAPSAVVTKPGVIHQEPPGEYKGRNNERIRVRTEVIAHEALGVTATVYYWADGRYRSLWLWE
jgi:hypothetical protein